MEYISADIGSYIGGKVHHWDWVDPDLMSLLELDGFLTDVGYQEQVKTKNIEEFRVKNNYSYYYRKEGMNMKEGLVELKSNKDLLSMCKMVIEGRKFIELYLIKKEDMEGNLSTTNLRASPNAMPQTNEVGGGDGDHSTANMSESPVLREDIDEGDGSDGDSGFKDVENEFSDEEFDIGEFEYDKGSHNVMIDDDIGEDIDTDCGNSDDLGSCHSSDDEGRTRKN
ncbi:unnamed protein product [Linum tenue]|uniref:PB1-like domain-containing protein n=1 Tax=Linum tenue TaxID=586396 RepID=A0AAV0RP86_9ROSI|nr:unnamed protein product [Linum tenue]